MSDGRPKAVPLPHLGLIRAAGWGLFGVGAVGLGFVWDRPASTLAAGIGLIAGLMAEALLMIATQIRVAHRQPELPLGARPADGVVHVWAMNDVVTEPPILATRWQRFRSLADSAPRPSLAAQKFQHRPLLGHVALISVFVGRDGRSWTKSEIRDAHRSLAAVGRWLEREAIRWSVPLNIGLASTFFQADDVEPDAVEIDFIPEGNDVGPLEAHAATKAIAGASRVAATLGFCDVADLIHRINSVLPADAHVWLWHLKQRGRSHAIPIGADLPRGVGLAICYARESSFPERLTGAGRVDPVTVAHELMHLFHASDLYNADLASFPPGEVSRRDIMRLDETRLDRCRIGRLSAREVGWPV